MLRQSQMFSTNSLRKQVSSKHENNSLQFRHAPVLTHHYTVSKLAPYLLPSLKSKNTNISVFLLYKDQKFVLKCEKGTKYSTLTQLLYKEIINFQVNANQHKSKQDIYKQIENVLGFSTVAKDLKTDYLMSIGQGVLSKSLVLDCFSKKKGVENRKSNWSSIQCSYMNSTDRKIAFNYQLYNCLAIGGFSKVYLARSYEDGNFYTIKFIRKSSQVQNPNFQSVVNQMQIISKLCHPFLIKMRQSFETTNFYCMVFQYCPGGELFFLLKNIRVMPQQCARFYFIQILLGIKYIHQQNILYRDLKPQNILIDRHGFLKIVDFGLSKQMSSAREKTYSYCGSAQYMAPEMILRSGHNTGIDYYSLGALLYELVTGLPPFYSKSHEQLQRSIVCQQLAFPGNAQLSLQLKDLLSHLLAKDQRHRLGSYAGIKEIMFHPWIGKFKAQDFLNKSPNLQVPYPPDLSQHNFDQSELGDDEQEFTEQVNLDFYQKNMDKEFKAFFTNESAITSIVEHQTKISRIVSDVFDAIRKEKERQIEYLKMRQSKFKNYTYHNASKGERKTHHIFSGRDFSDEKEKLLKKDMSLKKQSSCVVNELCLSRKIARDTTPNKKQLDSHRKMLPYFRKTKLSRPQKQKVPKANILKLKQSTIRASHQDRSKMKTILELR